MLELETKVLSVNISEKKGTVKKPVKHIELYELGVKDDAHSGKWRRQVSLLAKESIEKSSEAIGREIKFGEFAENITTEGIVLYKTKPGDRLIIGETELEITQIGKKCHTGCEIFSLVGNCVMPTEGIFARVIKQGIIKPSDKIVYLKTGMIETHGRAPQRTTDRASQHTTDRASQHTTDRTPQQSGNH